MAVRDEDQMEGMPTGFTEVDKLLGGLRGGDLIVLAARPHVGKSAFALNIATNAAKSGAAVVYFSMEMSVYHVKQRILCSEARVSLRRLRRGNLQEDERDAIINAADALSGLELCIDDTPGLSLLEMRAKARRQLCDKKKGLIIVDYLQLMWPSLYGPDVNSVVWCAEISRGLKALAKGAGMPVLALYNLFALRGEIESKRPTLFDLRKRGPIDQDADIVMLIDCPENETGARVNGCGELETAELIIAKHRNGSTRDVVLSFTPEYARFDNCIDVSRA